MHRLGAIEVSDRARSKTKDITGVRHDGYLKWYLKDRMLLATINSVPTKTLLEHMPTGSCCIFHKSYRRLKPIRAHTKWV
jgi:hypothetical protein